jgi:hypothetical protein
VLFPVKGIMTDSTAELIKDQAAECGPKIQ